MIEPHPPVITIKGLTYQDVSDIRDLLETSSVKEEVRIEEDGALPPHRLGEPTMFLLLASATIAGITVIAAFLMKKRKRTSVHHTFEVKYPDGTILTHTIQMSHSVSEPAPSDVVEKLSKITNISSEQIRHLLR